ncbi:hypothetical protein [Vibrio penaeicida]|uniref:hypothetical protein n=1 Tax=Vibrio penaeicida TaxID=104609 RepID=UPI000CEA04A1|nr:hypothetical protein [Vibrio penaeicida]
MKYLKHIFWLVIALNSPFLYATDTYEFKVKVTGYTNKVFLNAIIHTQTDKLPHASSRIIPHSDRNKYGHFLDEVETEYTKEQANTIFIFGQLERTGNLDESEEDGEPFAYIPLRVIDTSKDIKRLRIGHTQEVRAYSDPQKAFNNSYPFSEGFSKGYINSKNIEKVFAATRILIENGYVTESKWQELFTAFQQNIHFLKKDKNHIRRILEFMSTYAKLKNSHKLYEYYVELLRKLEKLNIDHTEIYPNQTLSQHIFEQLNTLLTTQTSSVIPYMGSILRTLRDEKRYHDCILLGNSMSKNIVSNEKFTKIILDDKKTRNDVLSAMQAFTECIQKDFREKSDNGSNGKIDAAKFQENTELGKLAISAYISLYESIESVLPRRATRIYGPDQASRVTELNGYYDAFSTVRYSRDIVK